VYRSKSTCILANLRPLQTVKLIDRWLESIVVLKENDNQNAEELKKELFELKSNG